jgi:uncharacterized protein YjbI with pentapeptide repeats
MKANNPWITYRTRFLVNAKQLCASLTFTDPLGRRHSGRKGDYLVESSDGLLRIAPRQIFEDIYVPMFAEATFTESNFEDSKSEPSRFTRSQLTKSQFTQSLFTKSQFTQSEFTGSKPTESGASPSRLPLPSTLSRKPPQPLSRPPFPRRRPAASLANCSMR